MIHLFDTDDLISNDEVREFTFNCGLNVPAGIASLKNNWHVGQLKRWLDARDICSTCRTRAMDPKGNKFTYGVLVR